MKTPKNTSLAIHSSFALALALAIWSPSQVISAEPEKAEMKMHGKMMNKTAPSQSCKAMMEQMKKVMEETKKQDAELATLVAGMNSAPEDKKLDLMAAIVTQMSERQAAMHARKAEMEKKMTQHMMEHMEMGKESMSKCPMMKMKGTDDKPEASPEQKPTAP
ncbi:hypothetical protein [Prosthecobacter sp.]|uniref:hypothetical protein n=1 Tax=Prosthecobacter sp. TaxID=1965333 RepID=UPI002489EE5D|nr:hypothetical protein [Prosthecobacter sp.]MDI1312152.1 hypothetical protein [Prosthecobacter sp.]